MFRSLSILTIAALLLACVPNFAAAFGNFGQATWGNISSAGAANIKYSAAYPVRGYKTKSIHVQGVTIGSTQASPTFKTMSGTVLAQCSNTSSGPWFTCLQFPKDNTTAVSTTTIGGISWQDAFDYIRIKWTPTTIGSKIKVWLNWNEN